MHQKSQKNNHGSAKLLDHHLVFKNDNNRYKTSNPSTSTQNSSSEDFNSPYKKFLGKIKHISLKNDSDDDFKTPVKSKPKVIKQKQSKKQKSSIKKTNSTIPNLVLKRTKDNFKNLDVNAEHLQMALALSKSTYAEEHHKGDKDTDEPDLPSFLSPNKIPRVTTFLEKYGFKSSRPKYQTERSRDNFEETRKPKSSKFRFLTPVLYSRSDEERKSLINSKVSLILNQQNTIIPVNINQVHENLNSTVLSRYIIHNNRCWKANDLDQLNTYVCQSIQISFVKSAVGCLLKNWSDIPGIHLNSYEAQEESNDELTETVLYNDNASVLEVQQKSSTNQIKETLEVLKDGTDQIENVNRVVICDNEKELLSIKEDTASCDEITEKRTENCSSPDLFSEDESDNLISLPAINRSHKEMTTYSTYNLNEPVETKSPSTKCILVENTNNVSICQLSDCDKKSESVFPDNSEQTEKNSHNNSIEYFESFYDDGEDLFQHDTETLDLTCDSGEDIKISGNNGKTDKSKECREISGENLETRSKISFGNKYSSMDSGNASGEYNSTKSLNVTDYVMAFLNTQENSDVQENPEIFSQSQSTCSQESIIVLSDEELNYSNKFSTNYQNNIFDLTNFDNFDQDYLGSDYKKEELDVAQAELTNKYNQKQVDQNETVVNIIKDSTTTTLEECPDVSTPEKIENNKNIGTASVTTPNDNILIKTDHVTPMADFDSMDTPNIRAELSKFGIKPLKRPRGIQLLKYIYESTHPYVNADNVGTASSEQEGRPIKKRKLTNQFDRIDKENIQIVGSALIDCENEEDLIFERKFSKKISSCCVPLQIVWYNFICCNPSLAENIILYEPIQLEVIHSMLIEQTECHFHIQDLITFLDKKCITFRTNQCQSNRKK